MLTEKQVLDKSGTVRAVSPTFRLADPPGLVISWDANNATVNKGDTCKVGWDYADMSFPVSKTNNRQTQGSIGKHTGQRNSVGCPAGKTYIILSILLLLHAQ